MKGFIARSSSFRRVSQIFSDVYTSKFSLSVLHVHLQVLVKEKMFAVKFGKENHNIELASEMRLNTRIVSFFKLLRRLICPRSSYPDYMQEVNLYIKI